MATSLIGLVATSLNQKVMQLRKGRGPVLEEGTVLAIEPMVNAGGALVRMGDDGWAVYSQDGSLAAHFEFTVAVTADGPRILTPWHEQE